MTSEMDTLEDGFMYRQVKRAQTFQKQTPYDRERGKRRGRDRQEVSEEQGQEPLAAELGKTSQLCRRLSRHL